MALYPQGGRACACLPCGAEPADLAPPHLLGNKHLCVLTHLLFKHGRGRYVMSYCKPLQARGGGMRPGPAHPQVFQIL